ncbi:hypothetical protein [Streptomyces sp. NPDC017991]|uniref:hypothetical protein n=1 Tax=Streptomyces sp. NPDC017991 TaxID=3365026 RepID=UPI0037A6329D
MIADTVFDDITSDIFSEHVATLVRHGPVSEAPESLGTRPGHIFSRIAENIADKMIDRGAAPG